MALKQWSPDSVMLFSPAEEQTPQSVPTLTALEADFGREIVPLGFSHGAKLSQIMLCMKT